MQFFRKAADTLSSAFKGAGKKESTREVLGANDGQEMTARAIQFSRDIVSGLHPAAGFIDDAVSMGQHANSASKSQTTQDMGINLTKGVQSTLSASAPVLAKVGMTGAAGVAAPLAATMAPAMIIGEGAARRMTDDKIRAEDADAYRKSQAFFGR